MTKQYTFHYKTNKLGKDGLFCERIARPIKSGIFSYGNYQVIRVEKEDQGFVTNVGWSLLILSYKVIKCDTSNLHAR